MLGQVIQAYLNSTCKTINDINYTHFITIFLLENAVKIPA